jgi:ABC transporter with metal-binding/Fe-S-binding domain ATP-binding protein
MRVGALFSGGKDSAYAAWVASRKDELACLVTLFPRSEASYMFHFPNLRWTALQAESIGVPLLTEETEGVKEEELVDLERALAKAKSRFRLEGIYTGALASVYQKTRVEKICDHLSLKCVSPLWGIDPETHLRRLVADGFDVVIVSVSALGLDQTWLGRRLDGSSIDDLVALGRKFRFHVGLEGGEGETFVLDAPFFSKRIDIRSSDKHWRGDWGYLEITNATLVPKVTQGEAASSRGPNPPSSAALP